MILNNINICKIKICKIKICKIKYLYYLIMLEYLSVPFLVKKYKKLDENFEDENSSFEEIPLNFKLISTITFVIAIIIIASLYYWAISSIITFNIPPIIFVICLLLLLMGNPLHAIIFLYLFKDKSL